MFRRVFTFLALFWTEIKQSFNRIVAGMPAIADPPNLSPRPPGIDLSERRLNGARAQALLNDPLLSAVFESVGNRYRLAWENAARNDLEAQRCAHYSLAALKDVQTAIRGHLSNAKIFEADLDDKRRRDHARNQF
jgi:hypothetical protein